MDYKKIAKDYLNQYGFNVIPVEDKIPKINWKEWQDKRMTCKDIDTFNWNSRTNGIGAIEGINNLRCLDFDHADQPELIKCFLEKLNLDKNYQWVVKSGNGYHIWFYCVYKTDLLEKFGKEKSHYVFQPRNSSYCKYVELRWNKCLTILPFSQHPKGSIYQFIYGLELPTRPPATLELELVVKVIDDLLIIENNSPKNIRIIKENEFINLEELDIASSFLKRKINNYEDYYKLGFALASLGEKGRKYFLMICGDHPYYPHDTIEELNIKYSRFLQDHRGDIKIGTLFNIAKKYGYHQTDSIFWSFTQNGGITIKRILLIEFLQKSGFGKYYLDMDYTFIQLKGHIVKKVNPVQIKDFVFDYVSQINDKLVSSMVKESLLKSVNSLFSDASLECLKTVHPMFVRDEKEKAHFFYKNGFLIVTSKNILFKPYVELEGFIWENQIIQRDYFHCTTKSQFETFIENVCRNDPCRARALMSAIGYLLHGYKNPTETKAVIFVDEKLSENAFGRTGKGLIAKAIENLKVQVKIDGRNFRFDKNFVFQSVNPTTQIIFFDDVGKKFDFEKLFSIITDGITIEKKNRDEFRIPFETCPKILITTNHSIPGNDDSSQARQFVIEFSDYYNKNHQPVDDFGKMFFIEWDAVEWNAFDTLMLYSTQLYLQDGFVQYEFVNLEKKKLIDATSSEFDEFIRGVKVGIEYDKKKLFKEFVRQYPDFGQMKQNTFTKWLNIYVNLYNYIIEERKSGSERFVVLIKKRSL